MYFTVRLTNFISETAVFLFLVSNSHCHIIVPVELSYCQFYISVRLCTFSGLRVVLMKCVTFNIAQMLLFLFLFYYCEHVQYMKLQDFRFSQR
jgi:hypothetical protein